MRQHGKGALITKAARGIGPELAGCTVSPFEVGAPFAKRESLRLKKREVGAADMSGMATFLVTEKARYSTARTLWVDGGNWMA